MSSSLPARAAVIGGGLIGGGWAARLVLNGVDVAVHDPDPDAGRKLHAMLASAERALQRLTLAPLPARGELTLCGSLAEAVDGAAFIQESTPERIEVKRAVHADIDRHAAPDALVGSSTSGLLPSAIQADLRRPERMFVAHPYNPVYLLPLVELVGGERTAPATLERAGALFEALGMHPVVIAKEIDAFVGDRLLESVWREALWLVHDDVATVAEIDDVIRHSFGLRWAQMGLFMTYRLGGGEAGMRHFMAQFAPSLAWPWTHLTDVPALDDALIDKIASQSDAQADGLGIEALERTRDDNLVAVLQALRAFDGGRGYGAGADLARYEALLYDRAHAGERDANAWDESQPLRAFERFVPGEWLDYNGHMNEGRYLQAFSDATVALLQRVGVDSAYIAGGHSYYAVETHLVHRAEVRAGEPIYSTTQVLGADARRLHLFHRLHHGADDTELASAEQVLAHVDMAARRACDAPAWLAAHWSRIAAAQASLPRPAAAGRTVGEPWSGR